jgi:hypothetical protein
MGNLRLKAPASVVADYFHLFVNRRAYTLQSNRPLPTWSRLFGRLSMRPSWMSPSIR